MPTKFRQRQKPQISVIMAVYNEEKYLRESIASVLNQTFKNFEFIIINDGSTDHSLEIIKNYQRKDKRIKIINNQKNLGLVKSLNRGLKIARGKYLARQDAGDISQKNRLEKQLNFLVKNQEVFLCGTNAIFINERGKTLGKTNFPQDAVKILPRQDYFLHPTFMFRNKGIVYREKFVTAEDYDLLLRLSSQKKKLAILKETLIKCRLNPLGISFSQSISSSLFIRKAREFYWQRIKSGHDQYQRFNPQELLAQSKPGASNALYHETIIQVFLKNKKYRRAKSYFKAYLKPGSLPLIKWIYYFTATHLPRFFILSYKIYRRLIPVEAYFLKNLRHSLFLL